MTRRAFCTWPYSPEPDSPTAAGVEYAAAGPPSEPEIIRTTTGGAQPGYSRGSIKIGARVKSKEEEEALARERAAAAAKFKAEEAEAAKAAEAEATAAVEVGGLLRPSTRPTLNRQTESARLYKHSP